MGTPGAPRWSPGTAVRKENQFTAAPDFIDPHDSEHLPLWGRIEASWHGLSPKRRVFLMTSLAILATWGGTSAAFLLDDLNTRSGGPSPGGGLAAGEDPGAVGIGPAGQAADGLLNATSSAPVPLPSLPPP